MKNTTIRIEESELADLELLAKAEGRSVSDEIREGIALLLEHKRNDPGLPGRIDELMDRNQKQLEAFRSSFQPAATSAPRRRRTGGSASAGKG